MIRVRATSLSFILFIVVASTQIARADNSNSAAATWTDTPITIDGKMDEAAWQRAPILGNWKQTRINPGAPAREPTEVRILYDRKNLYFGFHCLDSQPDKIAAYEVQNEAFLHQDDNVTIIIDTFLDHRNAYYFWTNALGVRTDGRIVNDGEEFATDWQGEWESMGSIVKDGWIVEVRIPFSNFQYNNIDDHTFGILLDREQVRLQEWSNWTPDGVNSAKVSRYSHLTGLRGIAPRSLFGLTAYMSAQVLGSQGQPDVTTANAGVDLRLSPTQWLTMKLTLNPDFAQVDVDQDVLWLDVIERSLPERRPFFLEGSDLFISPIRLFYSRRIAPRPDDRVLLGLEAVGKRSGFGFSVFDVQSQEHRADNSIEDVNAPVLRIQKDLWRRSSVSLLALGRFGDKKFVDLGIDLNLHVWNEFFFIAQAAKSFGPGTTDDQGAYHAEVHRFDTNSEFWLQYEDVGARFVAPLGYVPVLDKRSVYTHINYTWFTGASFPPRLDVAYDDNWQFNHARQEIRHTQELQLLTYMISDLALYLDGKIDNYGGFETYIGLFGFTLFPNEWQSLTLAGLSGKLLGADIDGFKASLNLKIGSHFVLKANAFYTTYSHIPPTSPLFLTGDRGNQWSFYGQARYQFSPNLYARITFQEGVVSDLVDFGKIQGTVVDAVFGWHYGVGSDLFFVYTQQPINGVPVQRGLVKLSLTY